MESRKSVTTILNLYGINKKKTITTTKNHKKIGIIYHPENTQKIGAESGDLCRTDSNGSENYIVVDVSLYIDILYVDRLEVPSTYGT